MKNWIPALALSVGCSTTHFTAVAPARADSIECARDLLPELGYRILSEDVNGPTIEAMRVQGASLSLGAQNDILVVRVVTKDGAQHLEVELSGGGGTIVSASPGGGAPAIAGGSSTPTYAAKVDAEKIARECGVSSRETQR